MTSAGLPLRFELVTLDGADIAARYFSRDSATYRTLFETGVPRDFLNGIFIADPAVSVYEDGDIGPLLRFARFVGQHRSAPLAVDPADGRVVYVKYPEEPDLRGLIFMNSSLPRFVETVRVLTERFPYEYWNQEIQDGDYAVDDLARLIESVDPPAYATPVDGGEPYWSIFVGGVGIGNYDQESITGVEWNPQDTQ